MKRAWLFALIAAILSTLAGTFGNLAEGQAVNWRVTLTGVATAALLALVQVLTPSKFNELEQSARQTPPDTYLGSYEARQLNLAKKKSFSLGGLLTGALTAGAQVIAGGGTSKQIVPIVLTSVLAAITGGAAYVNTPEPRPQPRDTLRWPQ